MKRKALTRTLSFLLCLALLIPQAVFAAETSLEAVVCVDSAVMRLGPSNANRARTTLSRGTKVTVSGSAVADSGGDSYSWYPVSYNAYTGYLRADQLQLAVSTTVSISTDSAPVEGDSFQVTVTIESETEIGAWLMDLSYDQSILQYVSGADSVVSGKLRFCNFSKGVTSVSFKLSFIALKAGTAALSIASPQIVAYSDLAELLVNSPTSFLTVSHLWGEADYEWNGTYYRCTATRTCERCGVKEEESVRVTGRRVPATCDSFEKTTYTAAFSSETFEDQTVTVVTGNTLGHVSAAAVRENEVAATCTESGRYDSVVYCSLCGSEISRETKTVSALGHSLTYHSSKAATCTEGGYSSYQSCSRCEYSTYQETAALGHRWRTASYTWSDDRKTCAARHACSRCGVEETETVTTLSKVVREATASRTGLRAYYAVFTDSGFSQQYKEASYSYRATVWGDANGDGEVTGTDVVRLKNYFAGYNFELDASAYELFPGADANGDGEISGKDVVRLKNYFAYYDADSGTSDYVLGPAS